MTEIGALDLESYLELEASYGFKVLNSKTIGLGSGNKNYLLATSIGEVVLSVIEEQTFEEVECMANTLLWLDKYSYNTSKLVEPQIGHESMLVALHGKPAFLKLHLNGEVCWDLTDSMLRELGSSIAKLHNVPAPEFLPTNIYYEQRQFKDALRSNVNSNYEKWARLRIASILSGFSSDLPRGFIHADIFCDNVLFSKNELTAIIDFELACNYFLIFDIAMAIVGVCLEQSKVSIPKVRCLLAGYESSRKLCRAEKLKLLEMAEYAAIATSVWRYWRYQIYQPEHSKKNSYLEMVSVAKQIRSVQLNDFLI